MKRACRWAPIALALTSQLSLLGCSSDGVKKNSKGGDATSQAKQAPGEEPVAGDADVFWRDPDPAFGDAGATGECRVDELLGPEVYGGKVKSLLTGLSLNDEELAQLKAEPDSLRALTEGWLELPEAETVLTRFFRMAFQQTELDVDTFYHPTTFPAISLSSIEGAPTGADTYVLGNRNFSDMFALTAWEIMQNDQPWTDVLTTSRYMMTPAIMNWLAFRDDNIVYDDGTVQQRTSHEIDTGLRFTIDPALEPPRSETFDRNHDNFMLFYHDNLRVESEAGCGDVPTIVELVENGESSVTPGWTHDVEGRRQDFQFSVFSMMWGRRYFVRGNGCRGFRGGFAPSFEFSDFTDWKMVDVRQPVGNEEPTRFYDLETMRNSNELVLKADHVGFMSTPGFQGTWQTNEDNSARVTINQILIVALGASFDGAAVSDFTPEGLDAEHAAPGTECYGCHQTLDPMRDFVRNSFTNFYSPQVEAERRDAPAQFVFGGVTASGNGIRDLANILAEHPYFPRGWTQKLCFYANSEACEEGPEFERVVSAFVDSGYNFKTLLVELLTSPMVTSVSCDGGKLTEPSIARRSLFCQRLSTRLGLEDLCAMDVLPGTESRDQGRVATSAESVPDDTFSRAEVDPVTIAETSLFIRANREVVCTKVATQAFDDNFRSLPQEELVDVLVEGVMGLPPTHSLHEGARAAIDEHIDTVVESGQSQRTAYQSAFIVACMSPGSAGVGF